MGELKKSTRSVMIGLFLLVLLAAIVIIFLLVIQKCTKSSHEHHLDDEVYRLIKDPLSPNIRPLHYLVDLDLTSKWHLSDDENLFTGNVKIVVHIKNISVRYIVLESRNLDVRSVKLFRYNGSVKSLPTVNPLPSRREVVENLEEILLSRWFLYHPMNRLVVETSREVDQGSFILLHLSFAGEILTRNEESGLLKYNLQDGVVLATTGANNFGGFHARRIFPCFDDPKFLSVFSLSLRHNSSFLLLSNTKTNETSDDHSLTIFKTTPPQATTHFAFVIAEHAKTILTNKLSAYAFGGESPNWKDLEGFYDGVKGSYEDIWNNLSYNFLVFPNKVTEPGIVTRGLISVSLPVSEEKLFESMRWPAAFLKMNEANHSWIEYGLEHETEIKTDGHDMLADDVAYRQLNWNNIDVSEANKNFIRNKAQSILRLMDSHYSMRTANSALKTVLTRRLDEDKNLMDLLDLQITTAWYDKSEDRQRKELLEKWQGKEAIEYNSTTIEEIIDDIGEKEKVSTGLEMNYKRMIRTWTESPDHPLLDVELVNERRNLKITQSGFHHPRSNHTWEFPIECLGQEAYFKDWIKEKESVIANVGRYENVVVNPRRRIYGRVKYDKEHWRRLFAYFNRLHVEVQTVLIQDLFTLAWKGHVQYDVAMNSLDQLKTPNHWIAEEALEAKIRQIDFALKDSPLLELWTAYVGKLSGHVYSGSRGSKGVVTSCLHGYQPCLEDALYLHRSGNRSLSKNHDLKKMALFHYGRTDHFSADDLALQAALVARDDNLSELTEKLKKLREGNHDRRSFIDLYFEVSKYYTKQSHLWKWFRANVRELRVFSSWELEKLFEMTVENFHGKANIDYAFYVGREGGALDDELNRFKIYYKLTANHHWRERNEKTLRDWLENNRR